MPRAKVVILNWNGRDHLKRFLPKVVADTPEHIEIVVADNGSTDDSCLFLKREYPSVRLLRMEVNSGYAGGYNRALSNTIFSDTDYCILLNSDVKTTPGWIEPLLEKMEREADLAALAPKILSLCEPDRFEYAGACGGFIDGLGYPFCRGRILSTTERDTGQYNTARDVFWASGACLCVRMDAFRQVGGFDSSFFAHMEEIDLCWRMQSAGWRVAVEPLSVVYHLGGGTLNAGSARKTYLNHRNNLLMLYKNLSPRSQTPVLLVRMITDGLSALIYLCTGKLQHFKAVWNAHIDFRKMKPEARAKRKEILSTRTFKPRYIWKGSIVLRYAVGKRRFSGIKV